MGAGGVIVLPPDFSGYRIRNDSVQEREMWICTRRKPTQEAVTALGIKLEQTPKGVNCKMKTALSLGAFMFIKLFHFLYLFTTVL